MNKRFLFRDVNARMLELSDALGLRDLTYPLLCECGQGACVKRIEVPAGVYHETRSRQERFIVAAGHELPGREDVVAQAATYRVVAAAT